MFLGLDIFSTTKFICHKINDNGVKNMKIQLDNQSNIKISGNMTKIMKKPPK